VTFLVDKSTQCKVYIHKEKFALYGGKCLSLKAFHSWVANVLLLTEFETEVRKWLSQQSKLYAASFISMVKQWDKRINVGGGYVE
jgi:hypothetical protein